MRLQGREHPFHLHWDQFPGLPGTLVFIVNYHLEVNQLVVLMVVSHPVVIVSVSTTQIHRLLRASPVEAICSVSHSRMSGNIRFPPKVFKSAM